MSSKNILVVGGDGFCGWPLSLRLSNNNHNVTIIDNLSRRKIDLELGTDSLTNISSIYDRIETWEKIKGKKKYLVPVTQKEPINDNLYIDTTYNHDYDEEDDDY